MWSRFFNKRDDSVYLSKMLDLAEDYLTRHVNLAKARHLLAYYQNEYRVLRSGLSGRQQRGLEDRYNRCMKQLLEEQQAWRRKVGLQSVHSL